MILDLLAIVAGFILLVKGADFFVDGAAGIANRFGIPQIIIGLTIVAMGTSAPEAAVSIVAALNNNAEITIGNIVGSNILNVLIILGVTAAIIPVAVKQNTIRIEMPFMIMLFVVLLVLGLDGTVSRGDSVILVALFIVYLIYLFISAKKNKEETDEDIKQRNLIFQILFSLGGMIAIVVGSKIAVYGATGIAELIGVSERFIGLTVVALGTSLPELVTSVTAAKKGNADIAIGNIVGSNIFNVLFVVGITAVITPVPFASKFIVDSLVMIAASVFLLVAVMKAKKLTRIAGILMIIMYAGYFGYLCIN